MADVTVNDGKGLYDNDGLIDSLIVDCNNLPKLLIDNHFIAFGSLLIQMVQKLSNLKAAIQEEQKAHRKEINELRVLNDDLAEHVYKVPVDRSWQDA